MMFRCFPLIVFFLVASANAQDWQALLPDARVAHRVEQQVDNHVLALGQLRKENNQWHAEREHVVDGQLNRVAWQMPSDSRVTDVHDKLHNMLLQRGALPLFLCSGLDCGSSNAWANEYFNIKELYGLDQHQYYGVWEWQTEQGELFYINTYVVQRGNQRVYVHIDQIHASPEEKGSVAPAPETLAQSLQEQGYFTLTGIEWAADGIRMEDEHLQALVNALQRNPRLKIRLVGHFYGEGDREGNHFEQQRRRSLQAAEQVQKKLVEAGIKENRISAHGVGSLAPARRNGVGRIETVRQ